MLFCSIFVYFIGVFFFIFVFVNQLFVSFFNNVYKAVLLQKMTFV